MELGEPVSVDVVASEQHDESCYFCRSKEEPATEENELVDNWAEDDDLDGSLQEVKFKNDASKLGKALGGKPEDKTVVLERVNPGGGKNEKVPFPVSVAAHHLIPGNAALKNSELFQCGKYLRKDGSAKGNIGYNVNSEPNGVWLPGNYAVRPWGADGAKFASEQHLAPKDYAFAAIEKCGVQFHDAHKDYSEFVKSVLDKIHDKLEANKTIWCPETKKKSDEDRPTLYALVSRLDTISMRMRRMLMAPTTNWKKNIYTSRFSLAYMEEKKEHLLETRS